MKQSMSRILWAWCCVALWVSLILFFASDSFSASSTSRFLTPFLRWLDADIPAERIAEIQQQILQSLALSTPGSQ